MTPKSFFTIILKIFGLFFLRDLINSFPQLFSTLIYFLKEDALSAGLSTIFFSLVIMIFYGVICWHLLFKTAYILNLLKLENEIEEDSFSISISQKSIILIALIVLGGIIITNEIPTFCRMLFSHIEIARQMIGPLENDFSLIIFSGIKIIIGLLLIGERERIANFIGKKPAIEDPE